ncbi:MAG: GHKL domain-containing protein [Ruminococcaceae bacterium]|nr:GHKL domain-containing protein [Oscillospiraceae bacterium]
MSLIENTLFVVNGAIELISLIVCTNLLGILCKNLNVKNRIIASYTIYLGISVIELFLLNNFGNSTDLFTILLYYFKFILAIGILYGRINLKAVYLIAVLDLSISLVVANTSCILANIFQKNSDDILPFVKIFIQITVLIIFLYAGKKSSPQRNGAALATIPRHIFAMLILAIICLSALSSLISYSTDNILKKESTLIAIVIILTIILISIVTSLFLNVIAKQHFTAVSRMMEKQVELQISHYEELEKMDAEISRFRHDYTNHLKSILSLIQMNEYSQAEEYIEKLQKVKYSSSKTIFYTGNKLADAILSDKSAALNDNCRIEYSGIIPSSIENVDLCVILSNALDNAVEACSEFTSPCAISIFAGEQQGYFVMSIKNPTMCPYNFYDIPQTTKSEKEQHGMGLYNIDSTVKKYNGQMRIKCENGVFELMLTLKM